MLKLSEDIENTEDPTLSDPFGLFKNDIVEGDHRGSPLVALWGNDLYYALYSVLNAASIQPSGARESITSSDFLSAIKILISNEIKSSNQKVMLPIYNALHGNVVLRSFSSTDNVVDFNGVYFVRLNGQTIPSSETVIFNLLDQLPQKIKSAWLSTDSGISKVVNNYKGAFSRASGGNASSVGSLITDSIKAHDHQSNVLVQNDGEGESIKEVRYEEVATDSKKISENNIEKNNTKSPRGSKEGGRETAPIHFSQDAWYLALVDFEALGGL